jgi:hypothetical protein
MLKTVAQSELDILVAIWPIHIHGLQKEVPKVEMDKAVWFSSFLGKDELQFMTGFENEVCASFGTDANPINTRRWELRSVRFNRNFETVRVKFFYQLFIKLE